MRVIRVQEERGAILEGSRDGMTWIEVRRWDPAPVQSEFYIPFTTRARWPWLRYTEMPAAAAASEIDTGG